MQIPMMWIYDYTESLSKDSAQRVAITNMIVKFMKEQEKGEE